MVCFSESGHPDNQSPGCRAGSSLAERKAHADRGVDETRKWRHRGVVRRREHPDVNAHRRRRPPSPPGESTALPTSGDAWWAAPPDGDREEQRLVDECWPVRVGDGTDQADEHDCRHTRRSDGGLRRTHERRDKCHLCSHVRRRPRAGNVGAARGRRVDHAARLHVGRPLQVLRQLLQLVQSRRTRARHLHPPFPEARHRRRAARAQSSRRRTCSWRRWRCRGGDVRGTTPPDLPRKVRSLREPTMSDRVRRLDLDCQFRLERRRNDLSSLIRRGRWVACIGRSSHRNKRSCRTTCRCSGKC